MLSWVNSDGKLVLLARATRTFGYGFLSVILFIYLKLIGFDPVLIGILISAILVSGALFTIVGSVFADRIGRKKFLILFAALMALSGLVYALTTNMILLILGTLIGTLSPTGGEIGAFLSLEQAILPQCCSEEKRNSIFAVYGTVGQLAGSAGALISGLPVLFRSSFGLGPAESYRPLFMIYTLVALVTAGLYLAMSGRVEQANTPKKILGQRLSSQSRGIVTKLSFLFGVDAFAGGFVLQSIISYWFFTRYGVSLDYLSIIFFAAGVLSSFSFIVAGRLADKIGLINTMVFTHLPSNIFLILVPLGPTFGWSLGLFLARQSISQMDVPTRQAYTVSVVREEERTVTAGVTNISRNAAQAVSPSLSGYAMQFVSLSLPFFVGGTLKIVYDLVLFMSFRRVKLQSETVKS